MAARATPNDPNRVYAIKAVIVNRITGRIVLLWPKAIP